MINNISKEELYQKFKVILPNILSSESAKDIAMDIFKKTMIALCESDEEGAQEIIECLEGNLSYNNFLTEKEAEAICSKFVNNDGSKGLQWRNFKDFSQKIEESGFSLDQKPYFNSYALWVTMNELASNHNKIFNKWTKENYFEVVYEFAVSKLIDKDNEKWIRKHFEIC